MIKNVLLFLLLGGLSICAKSQNYSIQNSAEFILDGIKLHDEEAYKSAIRSYNKVHRNDTNYGLALYEICLSQLADKQYAECIASCQKGIKMQTAYTATFYINYGNACSNMENYATADSIYDVGLTQFPHNASLRYNKAIAMLKAKKYKEGLEIIYDNLRQNPYHANSHLLLANICMDRELETQALMAYLSYLIMESSSSKGFAHLKRLDGYLLGNMDGENEYPDVDFLAQGFSDIDELIDSKVALSKKFKTPSKLTYPIITQSYLMMTSLETLEDQDGFWSEFYAPLYNRLINDKKFNSFSYYIIRSGENYSESFAKIIKKNKSKIDDFVNWFGVVFEDVYGPRRDGPANTKYVYNRGDLLAITDDGSGKYKGDYQIFHTSGCLMGSGTYKDGKKQGLWAYNNPNGFKLRTITFNDDVRNGPFEEYNEMGVLIKSGSFKNDRFDGTIKYFYQTGGLEREESYDEGTMDGAVAYYHENNVLSISGMFKDGVLSDTLKFFATNGQLIDARPLKDGNIHGLRKIWYTNGAIKSEEQYTDGKQNGTDKAYYQNGKLEHETNYKNGLFVGISIYYYENGSIRVKNELDENGKINGTSTTYYETGEVFNVEEYRKGDMISYKYFDKNGKVFAEDVKTGKYLVYKNYTVDGVLTFTANYVKGEADGVKKYYLPNNIHYASNEYKEGVLHGEHKSYYNNGQVKTKYKNVDGLIEGDFTQYSRDGKVITNSGFYINEEEYGEFTRKNSSDNVTSKVYYRNGELDGWQSYYSEKGVLSYEQFYKNGYLLGGLNYDTAGKNPTETWLDNGNGEYKRTLKTGETTFVGNYKNGFADGEFVWYTPTGKIDTKGAYLNNKRHGKWVWYHENGKVYKEMTYFMGNIEGEYKRYTYDGKLEAKGTYVNDELEGTYILYFWNGKVNAEKMYKNGDLNGLTKYYAPTGELAIIRRYIQNVLVGYTYLDKDGKEVPEIPVNGKHQKVQAYFSNGKLSVEFDIENDDYKNTFTWYYPSGKIYSTSNYKDGVLEGNAKDYQPDGKVITDYNYKAGDFHGINTDYYLNGKPRQVLDYTHDELDGPSYYYDEKGKLLRTVYYFDNQAYIVK